LFISNGSERLAHFGRFSFKCPCDKRTNTSWNEVRKRTSRVTRFLSGRHSTFITHFGRLSASFNLVLFLLSHEHGWKSAEMCQKWSTMSSSDAISSPGTTAISPLHYAHRVWRFRHMDSRARLCVRSGGGKSLWCPGSKSHHWWAVALVDEAVRIRNWL